MQPKNFSSEEFIQYNKETGTHSYWNGKVVHDPFEVYAKKIMEHDQNPSFRPQPAVEKPDVCCVEGCGKKPCESYLSNSHCPEHYAKKAMFLRDPQSVEYEPWMGKPFLGTEVVIRLSPPSSGKVQNFQRTFIIRFKKGKMHLVMFNSEEAINDWRFYAENGKPIFEIFDKIYFDKTAIVGECKAQLEGQPFCENVLKGIECLSTRGYPYMDNLAELAASSNMKNKYGLPGVLRKHNPGGNREVLTTGKQCVRCALHKRNHPEEKKVQKKPLSTEGLTEQLIASLQQQLELMQQLYKQTNAELSQVKKELSKAISDKSDLEERLRKKE